MTVFTHETKSLQLTLGRGITPEFVVAAVYNLRWLNYANVERGRDVHGLRAAVRRQFVPYALPDPALRHVRQPDPSRPAASGSCSRTTSPAGSSAAATPPTTGSPSTCGNTRSSSATRTSSPSGPCSSTSPASRSRSSTCPRSAAATELAAMRGFALNRFLDKGKFLANIRIPLPAHLAPGRQPVRRHGDGLAVARPIELQEPGHRLRRRPPLLSARFRRPGGLRLQQGRDAALFQFRAHFLGPRG